MPERFPSPEFSAEEQELIQALKERFDDPGTKEKLNQWLDQKEAWANEQNTGRANIEVNLMRAKLYAAAGFKDEAWGAFEDVRTQAHNEGQEDLLRDAEEGMDALEEV